MKRLILLALCLAIVPLGAAPTTPVAASPLEDWLNLLFGH